MKILRFKKCLKKILIISGISIPCIIILGIISFFILDLLFPFPIHEIYDKDGTLSLLVYDKQGNTVGAKVSSEATWHFLVDKEDIPEWLKKATIATEDKRFYSHSGIDLLALARAVCQNIFSGKRVSGASTISMQVIRITHPRPRTYIGKCIEMFRALQMERILDKDEILAVYLNNAPYGRNIVGIKAAAWRYFNKSPENLSCGEAALLAGLPKSPSRLDPILYPARALKRRNFVLGAMYTRGKIEREKYISELKLPVNSVHLTRIRKPNHICDLIDMKYGRNGIVNTTIESSIQKRLADFVHEKSAVIQGKGIDSLGMVVIDVRQSCLKALVSFPEYTALPDGQYNRICARRQVGSTLKPFIYACAADRGIIVPATLLKDLPCNWDGYQPENYDRKYRGLVRARTALRDSINIPAVRLLQDIGGRGFYTRLKEMDINLPHPYKRYGLTLALGTCEMRLITLANAYASIARLGMYRPLRFSSDEPAAQGRHVLSEASSYIVLDCLIDEFYSGRKLDGGTGVKAAYKTGTSWDYRDAWCIYMTRDSVIGVWLGNSSGSANTALVGVESAVPLAREFITLHMNGRNLKPWDQPETVEVREYCSRTGMLKGIHCTDCYPDYFITGKSSLIPCSHQDSLTASNRSELSTLNFVEKSRELALLAPLHDSLYILTDSLPRQMQKIRFRASSDSSKGLFWFLNGTLIGSEKESILWDPEPGDYTLICTSADGNSQTCRFKVIHQ